MIQEAFAYSEKYHTPVLFRPTTRVCHGYASIQVKDKADYLVNQPEGFVKDSSKWVIFPRLSYQNHIRMEERNEQLQEVFSGYERNCIRPAADPGCKKGIATAWYQLCLYHGSTPWQICARSAESGYAVPVPGTAGSGILTGTG